LGRRGGWVGVLPRGYRLLQQVVLKSQRRSPARGILISPRDFTIRENYLRRCANGGVRTGAFEEGRTLELSSDIIFSAGCDAFYHGRFQLKIFSLNPQ
jgi:hypothetical protein